VGAFGGKREIMQHLAPLGPVYQAGTLSGNPIAMTAGLKTLELISGPGFFETLTAKTLQLLDGLQHAAHQANIPFACNHVGGMFGFFFTDQSRIETFADVGRCDIERFKHFFHGMLERGIYLAPSAYEAGFMSIVHSEQDIADTAAAAGNVFESLA